MELRQKIKRASKAVVVATAGVLVATTSPAAAEPGAGVSTGSTNIHVSKQIEAPLCLKALSTVITLANTGSFSSSSGGVYEGTTTATFSTGVDFWFSPAGTFSNATCTMPTAVPGRLIVTTGTPTVGTSVACDSGAGNALYNRVNTNAEIVTADGNCVVNSAPALSSALAFVGSQQPCLSDFGVPEPCGTVPEWVGTYTQA